MAGRSSKGPRADSSCMAVVYQMVQCYTAGRGFADVTRTGSVRTAMASRRTEWRGSRRVAFSCQRRQGVLGDNDRRADY